MTNTLKDLMLTHSAARHVEQCFACGVCVAGCPVGQLASEYNLVQNAWEAFHLDQINPTVWWCATCYTCQDRCPYGVRMVEVIFFLQQLDVQRHGRPEFIDNLVSMVERSGYMGVISEATNQKRSRMGLPPLSTEIGEEIASLLERSAVEDAAPESEGES